MGVDRTRLRWNGWGWAARKDDIAPREEFWTWLAGLLGMPALLATPARPLDELSLPAGALLDADRATLEAIVGEENMRVSAFERAFHALGRSYRDLLRLRAGDLTTAPDAVVYPRSTEEVLAVLKLAARNRIAVVPFGGGTSAVGGAGAVRGKFEKVVSLDMTAMDRVIAVDPNSFTATAEAGISGPALEKALRARGFTLGHLPESFEFSTLGGWIAQNGAGQASNRYGCAADWLLGAKLACPRGQLDTSEFSGFAGPPLKNVIAGSEGVLGVVTEATVRIERLPPVSDCLVWLFRDFASGAAAMKAAVQDGIACSTLQLSDAEETRFQRVLDHQGRTRGVLTWLAARTRKLRGFAKEPALLVAVFEGDEAAAARERRRFEAVARRHRALALGRLAGERWRQTRFLAPYLRDSMMDRGTGMDMIETAAGWSKLEALRAGVRQALQTAISEAVPREEARGLVMSRLVHATPQGAGLRFTYVFPRLVVGDIEQWSRLKKAALDAAVAEGGTVSHHLGVGTDLMPWIAQEKGPLGLDMLRALKAALDPAGVLNPGKLLS